MEGVSEQLLCLELHLMNEEIGVSFAHHSTNGTPIVCMGVGYNESFKYRWNRSTKSACRTANLDFESFVEASGLL